MEGEDELEPVIYLNFTEDPPRVGKIKLSPQSVDLLTQQIGHSLGPNNYKKLIEIAQASGDDGLSILLQNYMTNHFGRTLRLW